MANSILKKKTREYVYRDGDKFIMTKDFLIAEVMLYRQIMNEVYVIPDFEFYPEEDAKEIIEELWAEIVENKQNR